MKKILGPTPACGYGKAGNTGRRAARRAPPPCHGPRACGPDKRLRALAYIHTRLRALDSNNRLHAHQQQVTSLWTGHQQPVTSTWTCLTERQHVTSSWTCLTERQQVTSPWNCLTERSVSETRGSRVDVLVKAQSLMAVDSMLTRTGFEPGHNWAGFVPEPPP